MLKKILLILIFTPLLVFNQPGFVPLDHKIYKFLDRLNSAGFISNYNSFEIPKSNSEIINLLQEISKNKKSLNNIDKQILQDLLFEFDFLITGSDSSYYSLLNKYNNDFSSSNKSFYYYIDSLRNGIFINLTASNSLLISNSEKADIINFGGEIRGYLNNELGFLLKGTNGTYKGNKNLALNFENLRYNYKAHLNPNYQGANSYFDDTEGYLYFEKPNFALKLGRDRIKLGYGILSPFIGNNAPPLDYFKFSMNYKNFNFSYIHGKLLDNPLIYGDSLWGEMHNLRDKYLVYHRFGIRLSDAFNFGLGEFIIYGNRSLDLGYLNPFNFYKSIEHINQDRDNSALFFDLNGQAVKGLTYYLTIYIDDIDFGKIGKKWYGNQLLWDFGLKINLFDKYISNFITLQYIRVEPYVFSHRIPYNNFTSLNFLLNDNIEPNSHLFNINYQHNILYNLEFNFVLTYGKHGQNIYDSEGNLIKNVGGSAFIGHRPKDNEYVKFLDGNKTIIKRILLKLNYEFIKNNFIELIYQYNKNSFNNYDYKNLFIINTKVKI